jgi:hypothetical protein
MTGASTMARFAARRAKGELLAAAPCDVGLVRIEDVSPAFASRTRASGALLHG